MSQTDLSDLEKRAEKCANKILEEFNRIYEICQSPGTDVLSSELRTSLRQAASDAVQLGLGVWNVIGRICQLK